MKNYRLLFAFAILLAVTSTAAIAATPPLQVKVLSAESHEVQGPPLVPVDCSFKDLDGYCDGAAPITYIQNTMLVQEPDGQSLRISCWVYNPASHCVDLAVNRTFQAEPKKQGLEIRYLDKHHKWRKQLYDIVQDDESNR